MCLRTTHIQERQLRRTSDVSESSYSLLDSLTTGIEKSPPQILRITSPAAVMDFFVCHWTLCVLADGRSGFF